MTPFATKLSQQGRNSGYVKENDPTLKISATTNGNSSLNEKTFRAKNKILSHMKHYEGI
jgi:hypothetical protein